MHYLSEPDFWVGVSFLLFLALLVYLKVPAMVARSLDDRAAGIQAELDEARRLREEAQALLAEYERKKMEAQVDAQKIVAQAKHEAEAYAKEARLKMQEQIARRTKQAEQKIAQAEATAIKDVRSKASDIAIEAAAALIGTEIRGAKAAGLIDESISAVGKQLN